MRSERCMNERKPEELPLRTMHDLAERILDEWNLIKIAVAVGLASSIFLTIFIFRWVIRFLPVLILKRAYIDIILLVLALPCMLFVLYAFIQQYRFLKSWIKRIQKLKKLEAELLGE